MAFDHDRFISLLNEFRFLNPEQIEQTRNSLLAMADSAPPHCYDDVEKLADDVLKLYLNSPVKQAERGSLSSYYYYLNRVSKKMIAAGELPAVVEQSSSVALVPKEHFNNLQWLQVKAKADLPDSIATAIDASRRRNELVESVLDPLFTVMLAFDFDRAIQWQLAHAGSTDEQVDPDVARDLIRTWGRLGNLPDEVTRRILGIAGDEMVHRHWPAVQAEADRVLRRLCLLTWYNSDESHAPQVMTLRKRHPFDDDEALLRWLRSCVSKIGESIDFFCEQAELLSKDKNLEDREWRQDALFRELMSICSQIHPLLFLSDLLLSKPDGSLMFAMAVFGFTSSYKRRWQKRLIGQCCKAVRRCFIQGMIQKTRPTEIIHRLCFGDAHIEEQQLKELDLGTEAFGSLKQREIVVERLAYVYASYREDSLLAQEVGLRYRRMMRVLHEDHLRLVLRKKQFLAVSEVADVLLNLATIASQSRRFVSMRRALDKSTEEIIASEIEYRGNVRSLRMSHIRKTLKV